MRSYGIKRFLKAALCACMVLLVIGVFCFISFAPPDAVSGATKAVAELQEDGAILHLMNGVSR